MVMMKKYIIAVTGVICSLLISCQDLYEVVEPDFNVWTDQNTYNAGDVVTFHMDGDPDMINFFSGEIGHEYRYHQQERIYDMVPSLSFRAAKFAGNNEDCAELLYSTDFDGNYEYENVKATNWINISDRFDIPPIVGTTATFSDAGKSVIADLIEEGKSLYFAWYCKTNEASQRTRFQVADFNIYGDIQEEEDLSGVLYTQAQLSFQWVLNENAASQASDLPSITNSLIYWNGIFDNTAGLLKDGYAISGPISMTDEINLGTDSFQVIKSIENENIYSFPYVFEKPGEYEVTFVAYNINYNGKKEVVKTIKLVIE